MKEKCCSVSCCENDATVEVFLFDVYPDGSVFNELDYTCNFMCNRHVLENEQKAIGTREPRGRVYYPFSNKYHARGFTIYKPIEGN